MMPYPVIRCPRALTDRQSRKRMKSIERKDFLIKIRINHSLGMFAFIEDWSCRMIMNLHSGVYDDMHMPLFQVTGL